MPSDALEIRAIGPGLLRDFLGFVEGAAFADNPKWKSCYWQFLYVDHSKVAWMERTADQNRGAACERIGCARMQ
jgi:hypothetical protein